jgi:hypothetical protein
MVTSLNFRVAAASNNIEEMEKLSLALGDTFDINEAGPKSGKTAAHAAAERANFKAIYWLLEKGADFHSKDNIGKTAADYLQEREFAAIGSDPMSKGDRKYFLCNAHCKIWSAHDPELYMPYLYENDFKNYRENNPNGYVSLVYSINLLSAKSLAELKTCAEKYQIDLISFEEDLASLTDQFGTEKDKLSYALARSELEEYPNQGGGNLAVVADLLRWCSTLIRKGSYADTDVQIGQHKWTHSISMKKALTFNIGTLIDGHKTTIWMNGDIIAASSLFPQPHKGNFRITLSKTACYILQSVQTSLVSNCVQNRKMRVTQQQYLTTDFLDLSVYAKEFFNVATSNELKYFTAEEIKKAKTDGLAQFSKDERKSFIEKMANLMRLKVEKEYATPEMARKFSRVFQDVNDTEHERFLNRHLQAMQMTNIKESVKQLSGLYAFSGQIWECIGSDNWHEYSIYSNRNVPSAFRSTNTVPFNTTLAEHQKTIQSGIGADLSFTPFGMKHVLERSKALQESQQ